MKEKWSNIASNAIMPLQLASIYTRQTHLRLCGLKGGHGNEMTCTRLQDQNLLPSTCMTRLGPETSRGKRCCVCCKDFWTRDTPPPQLMHGFSEVMCMNDIDGGSNL